ncbi:MAG: TonB-dependent receptor, partial [Bacteroidota bacterium]
DLLLKATWRLNQKTTLRAFGTVTDDYFRYARDFGYSWRNLQLGLQGDMLHNQRFSTQVSAALSRYAGTQFDPGGADAFSLDNGMNLSKFKLENLLLAGQERHTLRFGAEVNLYETAPESIRPESNSTSILPKTIRRGGGREGSLFLQDDWKISARLGLSAGLRWSVFQQIGAETVWQYDPEQPKEPATATGSTDFADGEIIETWQGAEPRFSGKYSLSEFASVKASWNRLRQYVHLISNSAAPAPADLWLVSSRHLPPQVADQFSLGFYKNARSGRWETSVEGWFKKISNQPEYKDLPELLLNERLETELLQGNGRSWGAELSVRKALGKWTGWLSYTWSQVRVKVAGRFQEETINRGNWYASSFDKPHQLSVIARCQINPRNVFNLSFTYGSGRPVTAPISYYTVNGITIPNFPERNALRIRDYHRLD